MVSELLITLVSIGIGLLCSHARRLLGSDGITPQTGPSFASALPIPCFEQNHRKNKNQSNPQAHRLGVQKFHNTHQIRRFSHLAHPSSDTTTQLIPVGGQKAFPLHRANMAQPREKGGRVVFIGNIPYGVSEEQIVDLFTSAGPVASFRLVYDKETGKPKGFGFLEYNDVDAAATAVRNLNNTELNGRTLRVDYSNDNSGGRQQQSNQPDGSGRAPPPTHFNMEGASQANEGDGAALPPLPAGTSLPPGVTAPDAISKTLAALPVPQLLDILTQIKALADSNPAQATALFQTSPQIGYATFQALLLFGLVDTTCLANLIQQQQAQPPPAQPVPPQPVPSAQPAYQPPPIYGQPPYIGAPPHSYGQPYAPTPPAAQQAPYQPPPPQPSQAPVPVAGVDPAQQAMIQQVLSLSKEQIFGMEENARNQILALRSQLGAPVY